MYRIMDTLFTRIAVRDVVTVASVSLIVSVCVWCLFDDLNPDNERYWIWKGMTCDGCLVPWLYVDTLLKSNGRATDQMQLESNGPASSEWLRGELEMYYDPTKESLRICPAESSDGSGYPWIYVAILLQRDGRAMGSTPLELVAS